MAHLSTYHRDNAKEGHVKSLW